MRYKPNQKASKKLFTRTARKTKEINLGQKIMRGGERL